MSRSALDLHEAFRSGGSACEAKWRSHPALAGLKTLGFVNTENVMRHHCDINRVKRVKAGETETMDDFTKKRIMKIMNKYAKNAVPEHVKSQIRISYKIRGNHVTLIEERQGYKSNQWVQMPVAQFRLGENEWKIYW